MSEEYVDALDHIMRVARASRTQSRRYRWIADRADAALNGRDWKDMDLPRSAPSDEKRKVQIRQLRADCKAMADFIVCNDTHYGTPQQILQLAQKHLDEAKRDEI